MSGVCFRRIGLVVVLLTTWLCSNTASGSAENEALKRLGEAIKEYSATAKELQKIDQFHISLALRRAVKDERPGTAYRWNNLHTKHKGEIVLLDFIGPRGNGRVCVDFKHTYYLGGTSPTEDEGTVCQNSAGEWEDIIVRAVFKGTGAHNQSAATPRFNTKVVREVQSLLVQLNYNPGPIDGRYGRRTKRAVEYYQRDEGLPITGQVSKELVANLERSVAALEGLPSTPKAVPVDSESTAISLLPDLDDPTSQQSQRMQSGDKAPIIVITKSESDERPAPNATGSNSISRATDETTKNATLTSSNFEPVEVEGINKKPILLTIDGIDFDPVEQTHTTTKAGVQTKYNLHKALSKEWSITDDWQHLPWRGTYSDITKNTVRAKNAIYRVYQTANASARPLVVVSHSWGGVLAYRAILELHKEGKVPKRGIDVLVTMGSPLSARTELTRNAARRYGHWQGSEALLEPVRNWLNYWIQEDPSSGAIRGLNKNTRLPYESSLGAPPYNAYHDAAVFRENIERDIKVSLQNQNLKAASQKTKAEVVHVVKKNKNDNIVTDAPRPLATQVVKNQETVATTQGGGLEDINHEDKTTPKDELKEFSNPDTSTEFFNSNWFIALIGFVFCVVAGVIASMYWASRVNSSTARQQEITRAAAELDSKIAIVTGQVEQRSRAEPKQNDTESSRQPIEDIWSSANDESAKIDAQNEDEDKTGVAVAKYAPSNVGDQGVEFAKSTVEEASLNQVLPQSRPAEAELPHHQPGDNGFQDITVESDKQPAKSKQDQELISDTPADVALPGEIPEETMEASADTPGQQVEMGSSADSQDLIIQAIAGFDELIKETEEVLAMKQLEPSSRAHISKAIEQATNLIKKAFEKDSIEGGSHRYTRKAIKKATNLIEEAVAECSTAGTTQLRIKNK